MRHRCFQNLGLLLTALGSIAVATPARAVTLTMIGSCPGTMDFVVTGASPFTKAAFVYAFNTGSFVVPSGYPCTGTVLGLDGTATLYSYEDLDASGSVTLTVTVPAWACGNIYVQVVDTTACTTSAAMLIP